MTNISFSFNNPDAKPAHKDLFVFVKSDKKCAIASKKKYLSAALSSDADFGKKMHDLLSINASVAGDKEVNNIHIVSVGDLKEKLSIQNIAHMGARIADICNGSRRASATVLVDNNVFKGFSEEDAALHMSTGMMLKNYKFNRYYKDKKDDHKIYLSKIEFLVGGFKEAQKMISEESKVIDGTLLARDLVSTPANDLYPESFAKECQKLSKLGVKIEILKKKDLENLKMNALLGVAQGSDKDPYVVIMRYDGSANKKDAPVAFVGKGVTFDTGGISIKPSANLWEMKYDMGGAAVVTGLMSALAARGAKVNAIGAIGLVENMCSGTAQRPGDVVTSMSGQTIEVDNTDAEGRLVLCDVLWHVKKKYKPKQIIDLATLTGAITVALGDGYAGLFSNDDELAKNITNAGSDIWERVWRLPLEDYYDKQINSDIADIKNVGQGRGAGSTTAAQFLHRFVKDCKWAHLDIAGVTWNKNSTNATLPKGATGFGVRLLNNFVKKYCEVPVKK